MNELDPAIRPGFLPPPKPQMAKVETPGHAVPDVTLLFDNDDDSIIWKPGTKIQRIIKDYAEHVPCNAVGSSKGQEILNTKRTPAGDIGNINISPNFPLLNKQDSKKFPDQMVMNTKFESTINSSPFSNQPTISKFQDVGYDPQIYVSPRFKETQQYVRGNSPILKENPKEVNSNFEVMRETQQYRSGKTQVTRGETQQHARSTPALKETQQYAKINFPVLKDTQQDVRGNFTVNKDTLQNLRGNFAIIKETQQYERNNIPALRMSQQYVRGNFPVPKETQQIVRGTSPMLNETQQNIRSNSPLLRETQQNVKGNSPVPKETQQNVRGNSTVPKETQQNVRGSSPLAKETQQNVRDNSSLPRETQQNIGGNFPISKICFREGIKSGCVKQYSQQPSKDRPRSIIKAKLVQFSDKYSDSSPETMQNKNLKFNSQYLEENTNGRYKINFNSESAIVSPSYSLTPPQTNLDPSILKLIEGQSQQILYLQKVLDKIMEQQNSSQSTSPKEGNFKGVLTSAEKSQCKSTKIAIVQTSFSDIKPQVRSIGTNTDISWKEILSSMKDSESEKLEFSVVNNPTDYRCAAGNSEGYVPDLEQLNISNVSQKREVSYTLKGVTMETVCEDPPSPEPSLHINIPEYQNDPIIFHCGNEDDKRQYIRDNATQFHEVEKMNSHPVQNFTEEPQANNNIKETPESYVCEQLQTDGATFLNNIMVNIQKILQKPNEVINEDEVENGHSQKFPLNKKESRQIFKNNDEIVKANNQLEEIRTQLQHFGISFLDPSAFTDGDKQIPDIYLPHMLSWLPHLPNIRLMEPCIETHIASNRVSDAELAAISKTALGETQRGPMKPFALPNQQSNILPLMDQNPNNFSVASRQFLGKYGLSNK